MQALVPEGYFGKNTKSKMENWNFFKQKMNEFEKKYEFLNFQRRHPNSQGSKLGRTALYFFVLMCEAFKEMPCSFELGRVIQL